MRVKTDIRTLSANLLSLFDSRTASDEALGSVWYDNAHKLVLEWADTYSLPIATVASVVAAISPQVEWSRNLIIADDILAGRPASIGGAIRLNIDKAIRIRNGRLTSTLDVMPGGPKVASFAANLSGDLSVVTVDTHASQAALNNPLATVRLNWKHYTEFAEAYRYAAFKANREPAVFQAIIWHIWKRLHPTATKRVARRQWIPIGEDQMGFIEP